MLRRRATQLLNLLFLRVWGGAPDDPRAKGKALFGDEPVTPDQQEMLHDLSADARGNTRGILQSIVMPEYVHKPQGEYCHGRIITAARYGSCCAYVHACDCD